jgi:hypothetical protein
MVAGLQNDRFDWIGPPDQHASFSPSPPGWITTGAPAPTALTILVGVDGTGVAPGTDLYGRVKNVLGS